MLKLPTVLLAHQTASGCHFDWMLGDPHNPTGKLWTARTFVPSHRWRSAGRFDLEPIAPHRRAYLSFEGPLTAGRGSVHRIDQGHAVAWMWTDDRILVQVVMRHVCGVIKLIRADPKLWRARFIR